MNSTSLEINSEPCLWFLLRSKSSMQRSFFIMGVFLQVIEEDSFKTGIFMEPSKTRNENKSQNGKSFEREAKLPNLPLWLRPRSET